MEGAALSLSALAIKLILGSALGFIVLSFLRQTVFSRIEEEGALSDLFGRAFKLGLMGLALGLLLMLASFVVDPAKKACSSYTAGECPH